MNGDEFKTLSVKLDELGKSQGELRTDVAGLRGEVVTSIKQQQVEIAALFDKHRDMDVRVREVEQNYVPQADHKSDMDANREEHRDFRDGLDEQRSFAGKVLGGAIVIGLIASATLAWVLAKV
jgi:uncharacterized protein YdcH (DUF465 family)